MAKLLAVALAVSAVVLSGCQKKAVPPAQSEEPQPPQPEVRSVESLAPPQPTPVISPAARTVPQTQPSAGREYVVQKSDTLWSIAVKQLGDGKRWKEIQALNGGIEPAKLKAGQKILLPAE